MKGRVFIMAYGQWMQGKFKPTFPEKYVGDINKIVCRSSWEWQVCLYFDNTPEILKWSSEERIVPYWNPIANRMARYFVDFEFWANTADGIKKFLVEVKPKSQTQEPKRKPSESDITWAERVKTWSVNKAKWEAAVKYAESEGSRFIILTEDQIQPNHNIIKRYKKLKVKKDGNVNSRSSTRKTRQK